MLEEIYVPLSVLVSRSIHCLYLGDGRKGMLWRFCREAGTVGWQGGWESETGPQIDLRSNKGAWKGLGKVLEGRLFLVFVTKSDGLFWWHTSAKRAPIALKQICRAPMRDWPCRLTADCLPWEHRWMQCLSSITAARKRGEKPLQVLFSHFTSHLCYYNADLVSCYPEGGRWCYW